jgi:hypothetical protein
MTDLVAFDYDRSFVLEALRRGDIDALEHVSEAAEADLFRHLIRRQVVQRLAGSYPTPRCKQEVPVWIYLSSELSLKLHGCESYHAFPRVLRCGGLIDALGPKLGGRKTLHPETGDVTLACPGFNHKNEYDRQTPCDQDFLRKFSRDTDHGLLHAWFNREVPRCLRGLGLFDPEGLFIGDASYLFVPDNPRYEDSDVLWFDEHNHPVDASQVDLTDKRYQQHRCYKLVSLLHVNRKLDFFFVVAAQVVAGRRHECPILYDLVEEVVRAVHTGVIKVLIVDRGLIDGGRMGRLKQTFAIDTIVPLRSNMDLYADAIGLTRLPRFVWEPYTPEPAVAPAPPPLRPAHIEKREASRQRTLALRKAQAAAEQSATGSAPLATAPAKAPKAPSQGKPQTGVVLNPALPSAAPAPSIPAPRTLLGLGRGLRSWSQCPVPLTAVVSREFDEHGHSKDWVLVSTSEHWPAALIRSTYALRPTIEERHRQYKCFWDLTRMHSCAFSLVVSQALLVLLAYTLVQAHLLLRHRTELNRGVWQRTAALLTPTLEVVAVYYRQRFCLLTLAEFGRILLEIVEPARSTLRDKLKRMERERYSLLDNARPP